jgi:SecD/SecF fusion protein
MSDLRFLRELGAEFERLDAPLAAGRWSDRAPRRWTRSPSSAIAGLGVGLSTLIVVVVVIVAVGLGGHAVRRGGSPITGRGVPIVFSATALSSRSPLGPSIDRSIVILRRRFGSVLHGVRVSRAGNTIVVLAPDVSPTERARIVALAVPGRMAFYDWEANALTSTGKTVASQLPTQDVSALKISQGIGSGPGLPGAGSMALYPAVTLAATQPAAPFSTSLARPGRQYYLFGKPGSTACAAAARATATTPIAGQHCLLSGPDTSIADLRSGLPAGVTLSEGQQLVVPQGTVVLQATNPSASDQVTLTSPSAQFYVLKDHSSLSGKDITNPRRSTDQSGQPDVAFGFTGAGQRAFQDVTATIAHRGNLVSVAGATYDQHFAVALDNQLLTVPSIDFTQYPDGIIGGGGADITGGFTAHTASDLAVLLRFGPLPVSLAVH